MIRWIFISILSILPLSSLNASIPEQLNYTGYLTNEIGEAVDCPDTIQCSDNYNLTFTLHSAETEGVALWQETHGSVSFFSGSFQVNLGSINPISATLLEDSVWLSIKVNALEEMSPRQKVVSSAYALRAGTAEQAVEANNAAMLGGMNASTFVQQTSLDTLSESIADAQSTLSLLQNDLDNLNTVAGDNESQIQTINNQISSLQSTLEAAQEELESLQNANADTNAQILALDNSLAPIAKEGLSPDLADGDDDTLSSLSCAEGEVARWNGSVWNCAPRSGVDSLNTAERPPCSPALSGFMYFDLDDESMHVCNGTDYLLIRTCNGTCPSTESTACGENILDDCGTTCSLDLGTALNSSQCNEGTTLCGQSVLDSCGNDCGTTGLGFDTTQCPAPSEVACNEVITDNCGNSCASLGSQCAEPNVCDPISGCSSVIGSLENPSTSCKAILQVQPGSTDGLYFLSTGGEPFQVYCDMTTQGGGWILTLISRNFEADQNQWFENAGTGTGGFANYPKAITSPPGFAAGPDRNARTNLWTSIGGGAVRASRYSMTDELLVDGTLTNNLANNSGIFCFATGCNSNPNFSQVVSGTFNVFAGSLVSPGAYPYGDVGSWGCNCSEALQLGGSCAGCGDSIVIAGDWNTTDGYTAFWIR